MQREILSAHRIEEIETNGIFVPEPRMYLFSQKKSRAIKHHVYGGNLYSHVPETHINTVFFGNSVKRPGIVCLRTVQVTHFLHPLTAPDLGRKIGNQTERTARKRFEPLAPAVAAHHFRAPRRICIEQVVRLFQHVALVAVGHAPFYEKTLFELSEFIGGSVVRLPVGSALFESALNLPASQIEIDV